MLGKSHLMVGLTAGIVFDSVIHVSGPPLVGSGPISLALIIDKALFYAMVALGALLPDIDNARSTMGKKLGWISRGIQHTFGHRTLFHSLLGLTVGGILGYGLQQLVILLLLSRHLIVPARVISDSQIVLIAIIFGCAMHILADALTLEGVPLLWPNRTYFGFPPSRKWRFKTGTWPEHVIVWGFLLVVLTGIYYAIIPI